METGQLHAMWDSGLDSVTEDGHQWNWEKLNKVCTLVNSIVPELISQF